MQDAGSNYLSFLSLAHKLLLWIYVCRFTLVQRIFHLVLWLEGNHACLFRCFLHLDEHLKHLSPAYHVINPLVYSSLGPVLLLGQLQKESTCSSWVLLLFLYFWPYSFFHFELDWSVIEQSKWSKYERDVVHLWYSGFGGTDFSLFLSLLQEYCWFVETENNSKRYCTQYDICESHLSVFSCVHLWINLSCHLIFKQQRNKL